jgi:hypothetical protein
MGAERNEKASGNGNYKTSEGIDSTITIDSTTIL